ncbi:MAG: cellulase family glycosylhydrolase [Thermoflexales bacterium]|nr:cellulase family glycosylhydrolase [Thermoflexales bacterium]
MYYGFNFQWLFAWAPGREPAPPDERALDFLAALGFNFVRIPTDYRFWTKDWKYLEPDEALFTHIDGYLDACRARGLHMSLNLHRAPGYCINANHLERHNLWLDAIAQDAFVYIWENFAHRYKGVPAQQLSFDLVNEPPDIGQYGMTRENHAAIIRRTVSAIRAVDPAREVVIDGLNGGNLAMPELANLGILHSGRGYLPMPVSHYRASWWSGHAGLPEPVYPGTPWMGRSWDRDVLREFYQSWRDVEAQRTPIHIGEMGCFNQTPNDVALRWLADLLSLFGEFGWGYALWEFAGPFGIVEHGRAGARYESVQSYQVDRDLLDLLLENRVKTLLP